MSRSEQPIQTLPVGVNLTAITSATIIRDHENMPVIAKDGSNGLLIRFSTGDNKFHADKTYWTKFSDFAKLCAITDSNPKEAIIPQLKGKRVWVCVKVIKTMRGNAEVKSENVVFDILRCDDPEKKPMISGDPVQHPKGEPLGVFIEYEQSEIIDGQEFIGKYGEVNTLNTISQDVVFGVNQVTGEAVNGDKNLELTHQILFQTPAPKSYDGEKTNHNHADEIGMFPELPKKLTPEQQAKLELGKKIIAEGQAKEMTSLNEPNAEKDPFEDIEPAETKKQTTSDPDWDDF